MSKGEIPARRIFRVSAQYLVTVEADVEARSPDEATASFEQDFAEGLLFGDKSDGNDSVKVVDCEQVELDAFEPDDGEVTDFDA